MCVLEVGMNGKVSILAKTVLAPVVALGVGFTLVNSLSEVAIEETPENPYKSVSAEQSLGMGWLDVFLANQPFEGNLGGNIEQWGFTSATRTLIPSEETSCAAPQPMPPYVIDVKAAKNDLITINAAITQTGMSKSIINEYEERASECDLSFKRISDDEIQLGDDTTLLFYGDTIVSISFDKIKNISSTNKENIVEQTRQNIIRTLQETGCVSATTNVADKYRNIYYTIDNNPVGLFNNEDVFTSVDMSTLPTLVEIDEEFINYPNLVKPEAPYPSNFPDVPKKQEKPNIPDLPEMTNDVYMKTITYEIEDTYGAGCGWQWSLNQKTPNYNSDALKENEENLRKEALREVNSKAGDFVNKYLESFALVISQQSSIVDWNDYVNNVNNVHNSWIELENERNRIRSSYYQFVENYNQWIIFDRKKELALENLKKMNDECSRREEEYDEWVENNRINRDDSDQDSNQDNSDEKEPVTCDFSIPRSPILDMSKPAEPSFSVPPNVTIPQSWKKTNQPNDISSLINSEKSAMDRTYSQFLSDLKKLEEKRDEEIELQKQEEQREREQQEEREQEEQEQRNSGQSRNNDENNNEESESNSILDFFRP